MLYDYKLMRRELVVQLLTCISLSLIQFSNGQQCNTMLPANSRTILDSNTLHTINMAGQMIPSAIPDWIRIDVDEIIYTVPNLDTLEWRPPSLNTGQCGPIYQACIQGSSTAVDSAQEMNWLVSRYYETEANVIYIQVECTALTGPGFATDCRDAFQIFYYQSDQATTINSSLLSQFLPAESNKTVSEVVSTEFTKSKQGFYIGFFNNIPCPALKEFLFYYFECPATNTSDLYSLPATLAPNSTEAFVRVDISCPTGSLHRDPLGLVAECYWDGTWILPAESVCECEAGYYLSVSNANSSMPCVMCRVDTYKGETGNSEECSVCPFRSSTRGMEGSSECLCDEDWYRGEGESVSESCGQSPSAVVNLRVERGDRTISRVVWDEPLFLGNRSENELRYNVSYFPSLTPSSEESVGELEETELMLSSGVIDRGTEYVFVVTSWNSVSFVSGVFNRANVTVLSSFPTLLNVSYNESSEYLQWSYELSGEREYVFEISYANISHGSVSLTLNSGECRCSNNSLCTCIVATPDLDSIQSVSFRLMVNVSGILINTSLSTSLPILTPTATSTPNPITTPITISTTTPFSTPISNSTIPFTFPLPILIGVIVPIFVILIITLSLCICLIIFLTRKVSVRSKSSMQAMSDIALVEAKTSSAHTNVAVDVTYQDPRLYLDLNKAIRSLTKELDHCNIKPHCVIGSGEFGEVCKGTLKKNDRDITVAIKTLKLNSTEKNKEDFFREASAMGQFTHENVIYLYGVTLTKPIMIITPYMENGSLDKFLVSKKSSLVLNDLANICLGVAKGMNYLSSRGFVHRDLAARNILIDSDLTPKIADFGLSRETEENFYNVKSGGKIPVRWTDPEAILYRKFNIASDVWSYGVLMWEVMSFGNTPYGDMDNYKLLEEIQQGFRLSQPEICPYSLYTLMGRCWDTNQENRPTFIELEREIHLMIKNNFYPKPRGRRVSRQVVEPHSPLNFTSVDDWLASLKMERYSNNFKANSYTQISSIWHMTDHDLMAIDVIAIGHRNKMMQSIHTANSKLSRTYSVRV